MNRLFGFSAAVSACVPLLASCSSRPAETGLALPASERAVASVEPVPTRSAEMAPRPQRPVPEVIPRARPFRFSESLPTPVPGGAADPMPRPAVASAPAVAASPADAPAIAGIRATMDSYLRAFNRHDVAALAAHWSDAGTNVDLDSGATTSGREAVRDVFAALFEQDSSAAIDIDLTSIRLVRDDVAVVDGVSRLSAGDEVSAGSRFSAVLVRRGEGWMLDSVRESKVPAELPGHRSESSRPLEELSWLVGSWEDVSEGVTASTQCSWSTNRAFLIRIHLVSIDAVPAGRPAAGDGRIPGLLPTGPAGTREITEVIGWDPDRREIRSWLFTSDGGFAEGSWQRDGGTWTVRFAGHPAAAGETPAGDSVYTLTRTGADEISCRSSGDRLAAVLPPGCDFLRTARSADRAPGRSAP